MTLPIIFQENNFQKMIEAAERFSQSGLVPYALKGKPQDILIILQMGQELGLQPMQSLNEINVIQGRPSASTKSMLGLIRSKFPNAYIKITQDEKRTTCEMRRDKKDEDGFTSVWDIARAAKMNLLEKDNWKKQPLTMLSWRSIAEAARMVFPDVIMNLYTPDEATDTLDLELETRKADAEMEKRVETFEQTKKEITGEIPVDDLGEYIFKAGRFKGKKMKEIKTSDLIQLLEDGKKIKTPSQIQIAIADMIKKYLEKMGIELELQAEIANEISGGKNA